MTPSPTDWQQVALGKLTTVLGEADGRRRMQAALDSLGLLSLSTVTDFRRLAEVLVAEGGFAAAVGGLLSVHASIYGHREQAPLPEK